MMHAVCNPQSRLPVPLQLMADKVKIPVGHAVKFTGHLISAHLMGSALGLFGGRIFSQVTEHVDTRHLESSVMTHGL